MGVSVTQWRTKNIDHIHTRIIKFFYINEFKDKKKQLVKIWMAGLPASPAFANPAANALAQFNTPAVAPGAIDFVTVYTEASRKRKLCQAVEDGLMSGGVPLVTPAEAGMADERHAASLAQAATVPAPPWLGPIQVQLAAMQAQLAEMQAQMANTTISRSNEKVNKRKNWQRLIYL